MNTNYVEIHVFGKDAEAISDGDTFVATVDSVEGHKRVTMHRREN